MNDKAFSSLRRILQCSGWRKREKKLFICHRCTDLTTINNAKNIDSKLMLPFKTLANTIWGSGGSNSAWQKEKCDWCHQRWQKHYFPFSKSSTETWCDTLNLKNQKAQVWYFYKYCHVSTNIVYFQVCHMQWTKMPPCEYLCGRSKAKARDRQPERKAERKNQVQEQRDNRSGWWPPATIRANRTRRQNSQQLTVKMSLTCFSSRRSSNEDKKEDIRRLNTEDIFPENIAAPNIEEDEKCEHGNKFSLKLTPIWPVSDIYSRLTTRYVGIRLYLSFSYQQVYQSLHQFREVGYQLVKAHLEDWKWRSQALPPPPRCPPHWAALQILPYPLSPLPARAGQDDQ